MTMWAADFDMTRENSVIYGDEVAVVNVMRRLKRNLPTGYGKAHFEVEFVNHFGRYIRTTLKENTIVGRNAPGFIAEVINVTQSEEEEVQAGGPQGRSGS